MRLTAFQQQAIRESVRKHLPDATIYLYGSRTDDAKRGGDIDLLIVTNVATTGELKTRILKELFSRIGERHIDLLIEREGHLHNFAQYLLPQAQVI